MDPQRDRQLAEIEALQAIYPGCLLSEDAITAKVLVDGVSALGFVDASTALRFSVSLDGGVSLALQLPPLYPAEAVFVDVALPPNVNSIGPSLSAKLRDRAAEAAMADQEAIWDLCCLAVECAADAAASVAKPALADEHWPSLRASTPPRKLELMRVFFWAHHIRRKQEDMLELAEELGLTGLIMMYASTIMECTSMSVRAGANLGSSSLRASVVLWTKPKSA